ncbi:hypothetical protein LJK88_36905 [Paenibacillus sp. P26]|nr:hypothetical protein LJK88_36905 [Paenibacillus sp. P26]UUZ93461.1 hypothetical protein LJK87_01380 [Paenibacillus sp. P25]
MNEEKELAYLIEHFEKYLNELQLELEGSNNDLFLQGKIEGVKHSLLVSRMLFRGRSGNPIDVIID